MNTTREKTSDSLKWDDTSLAAPHQEATKSKRVNAMFDAIADSYDLNNRVHSLWRDQAWRRKAVRLAQVKQGEDRVVDVACGTGDLTFAFANKCPQHMLGIDFVPRMVTLATQKAANNHKQYQTASCMPESWVCPEFTVGDAMQLDLPDESVDIVSIAFGIRNVQKPDVAIGEFRRILKPGGRVVILEFSQPRNALLRGLYGFYFSQVMPRTATWISRDRSGAYKYLPRSVSTFIDRPEMVELMTAAGFSSITIHPMTFGICIAYVGHVSISDDHIG